MLHIFVISELFGPMANVLDDISEVRATAEKNIQGTTEIN